MTGATHFLAATGSCTKTIVDTCSLPQPAGTGGPDYLNNILTLVFAIAASVAVLLIAINGLRYIIARGDPGGTASAKDGMLYAVVGLLVVITAYSIVIFVVKGLS